MSQLLLSALAVVCPNCDGHNPPRAATCGLCGTGLGDAPPPRVVPARPAPSAARPGASPPGAAARPTAVAPSSKAAEAANARSSEAVPPGLKPSAGRTPLPTSAGVPVDPGGAHPPAGRTAAGPSAPARAASPEGGPRAPAAARPPHPAPGERPAPPVPEAHPTARPTARPAPAASKFGLSIVAGASRGQRYKLPMSNCVVGRSRGAILFAEDLFVSALHATFLVKEGALFVRDETSASGVYVTVPGTEAIAPRTLFSAGLRLFRFSGRIEAPVNLPGQPIIYGAPMPLGQALYAVEEILVGGRAGRAVVSAATLLTIGQAHCDLSYPQDEGLAGRHCELSPTPTGAMLRDLSGGLGTYIRIPAGIERPLRPGDRVRIGQHVLQVEALG
ncbi:FHA domain protein [Stigmatella aurantiaca DW4/3-1]|nr:FHA domain-containing protein [Stigmatella aurantiaca]ADO71426.1 FHA domain protein [Stigmatella aurantiaca DW4/3-1]